jgi:N-sulfoglucosamine sulfohydrolase
LYRNAFSTAGVCSPSRCAVITGMYATSIGAHHHRTSTDSHTDYLPTPYETVPPPYVKTFTEYMRGQGYYCTNNRKTDYQFAAPFTSWDENNGQAHWRNRKPGSPFFAVFNLEKSHESGMWRKYDRLITDPADVALPPYLPDTEKSRRTLALHYDNLAENDAKVGMLLEQLEEDGLTDNTIVFIWSDHGEGLPRHKRWLYDSGTRVPLIVRWPGRINPGTVSDRLVSMIDLTPTVLSLTGITVPKHLQGEPFIGPKASEAGREFVYAARDRHDVGYDMVRSVRDSRFKYIRNFYPDKHYFDWVPYGHQHGILQEMWRLYAEDKLEGPQKALMGNGRPAEELYDILNDPHEIRNLAEMPEYRGELARLSDELDRWRSKVGDMGEVPEPQMAKLMWPEGTKPVTAPVQFVPIDHDHIGNKDAAYGGVHTYKAPALLMLYCATQGASIAYTTEQGENCAWTLYTSPLRLPEGRTSIRAKAVRIGYAESREAAVTLDIQR